MTTSLPDPGLLEHGRRAYLGKKLAADGQLWQLTADSWLVKSAIAVGDRGGYIVNTSAWTCTCPDAVKRVGIASIARWCKHMWAVGTAKRDYEKMTGAPLPPPEFDEDLERVVNAAIAMASNDVDSYTALNNVFVAARDEQKRRDAARARE